MNWSPLLAFGFGTGTALVAAATQSRLTARRDRAAWQRDRRTEVYSEAIAHARVLESKTEDVAHPYAPAFQGRIELPHVDLITAKLRLLGTDAIFDAWKALREAENAFIWVAVDEYAGPDELMPNDEPVVVKLRQAVAGFYSVVKKEFDD